MATRFFSESYPSSFETIEMYSRASPSRREGVQVVVSEQLELHFCFLELGVATEARDRVVVSHIQTLLAETRLPERHEDICQEQDVIAAVGVDVVPQGLAPKGRPDLLRIGVVRLVNVFIE